MIYNMINNNRKNFIQLFQIWRLIYFRSDHQNFITEQKIVGFLDLYINILHKIILDLDLLLEMEFALYLYVPKGKFIFSFAKDV